MLPILLRLTDQRNVPFFSWGFYSWFVIHKRKPIIRYCRPFLVLFLFSCHRSQDNVTQMWTKVEDLFSLQRPLKTQRTNTFQYQDYYFSKTVYFHVFHFGIEAISGYVSEWQRNSKTSVRLLLHAAADIVLGTWTWYVRPGILPLLHACRKPAWLPCWPLCSQQVLCQRWIWRDASEKSTLALKPSADVTRSPKQGYQWPHKKNLCPPKFLKRKTLQWWQRASVGVLSRKLCCQRQSFSFLTCRSPQQVSGTALFPSAQTNSLKNNCIFEDKGKWKVFTFDLLTLIFRLTFSIVRLVRRLLLIWRVAWVTIRSNQINANCPKTLILDPVQNTILAYFINFC